MNAGRELDALVAEKVMGLCTGKTGYVSEAKLTAQYLVSTHDDYVKSYGEEPNADWLESEVDDRVRETVGGDYPPKECDKCEHGPHRTIKSYSTDIAAAWTVVEKLHDYQFTLQWQDEKDWHIDMRGACLRADTAPLAICLAALRAVGVEP